MSIYDKDTLEFLKRNAGEDPSKILCTIESKKGTTACVCYDDAAKRFLLGKNCDRKSLRPTTMSKLLKKAPVKRHGEIIHHRYGKKATDVEAVRFDPDTGEKLPCKCLVYRLPQGKRKSWWAECDGASAQASSRADAIRTAVRFCWRSGRRIQ